MKIEIDSRKGRKGAQRKNGRRGAPPSRSTTCSFCERPMATSLSLNPICLDCLCKMSKTKPRLHWDDIAAGSCKKEVSHSRQARGETKQSVTKWEQKKVAFA
jgi:hypothetical protein